MNVKLQALINCGRWVEAGYGRRTLDRVLARCRPDVRARYESGIAIEWVPMADLMEFYEAVVAVAGDGDRAVLRASGAASARKNFQGWATRMATWLLSAESVLRRASSLWRQYNDGGELCLVELSDGVCRLEIRGVPMPHWGFCTSLLGWADELASAVGWKKPRATHPECRADGGERCIIDIRFQV